MAQAAVREVWEETGLSVRLPADPAFTVTDAIFDADGGDRSDDAGGRGGTGADAGTTAGTAVGTAAAPVHYHYALAHLVGFAEDGAVPVAADDADDAAWFDVVELRQLEETGQLVGSVRDCVRKGVRSLEAGLLGVLEQP